VKASYDLLKEANNFTLHKSSCGGLRKMQLLEHNAYHPSLPKMLVDEVVDPGCVGVDYLPIASSLIVMAEAVMFNLSHRGCSITNLNIGCHITSTVSADEAGSSNAVPTSVAIHPKLMTLLFTLLLRVTLSNFSMRISVVFSNLSDWNVYPRWEGQLICLYL
jgi:hypothetical protein